MPSKANICYHVLRKAGVLVRLNQDVANFSKSAAVPKKGETLKRWKERVLGSSEVDIEVFVPYKPAPQVRMATLKRDGGGAFIKRIFDEFAEYKDGKSEQAVTEAESETAKLFLEFPAEAIQQILDDHRSSLEPSVIEFLNRLITSSSGRTKVEALLVEIVLAYNDSVRNFRNNTSIVAG